MKFISRQVNVVTFVTYYKQASCEGIYNHHQLHHDVQLKS